MRPAPLKAIMAHCATENRYSDDAHYAGGVLLPENFEWGLMFQTLTALPPDPAFVGKRWREMWKQRLDALMPVITEWTRHQRYDSFWRQGSVQTDYSRISCPVYIVDGQLDPYRDFRGAQVGCTLAAAIEDPQLMFDEHRLGHHGPEASWPC